MVTKQANSGEEDPGTLSPWLVRYNCTPMVTLVAMIVANCCTLVCIKIFGYGDVIFKVLSPDSIHFKSQWLLLLLVIK